MSLLFEERDWRIVTTGLPHPRQIGPATARTVTSGVPIYDVRCAGQVICNSWSRREELARDWDFHCGNYVHCLKACAFCGRVRFGNGSSGRRNVHWRKIWPPPEFADPPAAFSNVLLLPYMLDDSSAGVKWNACQACCDSAGRDLRQQHVSTFSPNYITHLLSARPTDPLMLSVVQCNVRFTARICGFLHTQTTTSPYLLRGPLVYWGGLPPVRTVAELPADVRCAICNVGCFTCLWLN
jgi:hypothetical protein